MPEIGSLVVKLQAQTAQFHTEMARSKQSIDRLNAAVFGSKASFSKMESGAGGLRAQLGLLDNTMRHNVPMAMADMVRRFSDSALVMNALPFAATVAGFVMVGEVIGELVKHLNLFHSGLDKLDQVDEQVGVGLAQSLTSARDELIQTEIEVDNLTGDHLDALRKQIELIDDQTLDRIYGQFQKLAGIADKTFKELHDSWFMSIVTRDEGSGPMKELFEKFQQRYEMAYASNNQTGMDLAVATTLEKLKQVIPLEQQARRILELPESARSEKTVDAYESLSQRLQQMGYGIWGPDTLASAEKLRTIVKAMADTTSDANRAASGKTFIARTKEQTEELRKQQEQWKSQQETIAQISRQLDEYSDHMVTFLMDAAAPAKDVQHAVHLEQPYGVNARPAHARAAKMLDPQLQMWKEMNASQARFFNGFSQGISRSIVEGQQFGTSMRSFVGGALESIISMILRMGMEWVITHTIMRAVSAKMNEQEKSDSAKVAGANATASFAKAPWPLDLLAPAFGASMMASAMSFEVGGKIPGSGAVPIIGHGGETVVTKALTDRVERAERGGGAVQFHYHDNSTHQALDSSGMSAVLANHRSTIMREVSHQLRRMNR